jgi:hypothetical protein
LGTELFHADRQTDGQDEAVTFRNFAKAPKKNGLFPLTDKSLFDLFQVQFCSQNRVTTANRYCMKISSDLSDANLADRCSSLSAKDAVPLFQLFKALSLTALHCIFAGLAATTWRRAAASVTKHATQTRKTKPPPNRVPLGPNPLRSEVLHSSYSSFQSFSLSAYYGFTSVCYVVFPGLLFLYFGMWWPTSGIRPPPYVRRARASYFCCL